MCLIVIKSDIGTIDLLNCNFCYISMRIWNIHLLDGNNHSIGTMKLLDCIQLINGNYHRNNNLLIVVSIVWSGMVSIYGI